MRSPSLAPTRDPVHFVLCDFGKLGQAYVETQPVMIELMIESQIVDGILYGQYDDPVEVIAVNVDEGWARDVSEDIAGLVVAKSRSEDYSLAEGARRFVEKHLDEELEPELCA
jgi:membrane protein required for beta-lactamase induction